MRFPPSLNLSLMRYLGQKRLQRQEKFPLVLMLEPTHMCNLSCVGCGRIQEYQETLGQMLSLAECLEAVDECGTPVVTANSSSLPEVAGEAALLVDPYNVAEIAAAMRRVLEDRELAEALRQKGLARAATFTWEKTARETIAVYEKVLGEKIR